MRPVRLDLDGFACFRRPTGIDFAGADYVALVGPTGSGKSTIIDGIVFALYGTAPRWGRANAIEYALAPTMNRGTVRLLFDVGEHRYVVAREVRRSGKTIQQRTVSLERLLDPDDEAAGTVVLAADPKAIRDEIEHRLIGLSYDDFTQCVVLPQGQFADFLRARTKDRQDILIKLLGADRYERIRAAASARAKDAQADANALTNHLATYQDATDDALRQAHQRVQALAAAQHTADTLGQALTGARDAAATAEENLSTARARLAQVRGIRIPDGLTRAQQQAATTREALHTAQAAAQDAAHAHARARTELDAAGDRGRLSARLADWQTLTGLQEARPALERAAADAATRHQAATRALAEAETALDAAGGAQRQADDALALARRAHDELTAHQRTLTAVTVPTQVPELADRWRQAHAARTRAQEELAAAEAAEEQAEQAAGAAPAVSTLEQALALAQALPGRQGALTAAQAAAATAETALATAAGEVTAAETTEQDAAAALDQALTEDRARALRAELADGDPCPVCGAVVHGPTPGDGSGEQVAAARSALERARAALATAREHSAGARDAALAARSTATRAGERLAETRAGLDALGLPDPSPDTLATRLAQAKEAADALPRARAATRRARSAATGAEDALTAAGQAGADARAALTRTVATLIPLGHDGTQDDDLATAWQRTADWAAARAATVAADLTASGQQRTRAEQAAADATDALTRARATAEQARTDVMRAEVEAQRLRQQQDESAARAAALTQALAGGPDQATTQAEVDRAEAYARAESAAYDQVQATRTALDQARAAADEADRALADSRAHLREQGQAVQALGPPTLDEDDLTAAWATLTHWATGQAETLENTTIPALEAAAGQAGDEARRAEQELAAHVAGAGLPAVSPLDHASVRVSFADAAARAQAAHATLTQRTTERARVAARLAEATERATVADTLEKLLRVNNFQKWLAGAALETLVQGASDALRELSGGQFDLTHENGEFYVIDHVDADAMRSVKTLSGGETFQASLALALTLSEQLSSLTTTGRARLDSIFLDEGFGTLDADSLDVVAATLERLTQSERMVGIVTHVTALADRVPVRFEVTRDAQGSHVARQEEG